MNMNCLSSNLLEPMINESLSTAENTWEFHLIQDFEFWWFFWQIMLFETSSNHVLNWITTVQFVQNGSNRPIIQIELNLIMWKYTNTFKEPCRAWIFRNFLLNDPECSWWISRKVNVQINRVPWHWTEPESRKYLKCPTRSSFPNCG